MANTEFKELLVKLGLNTDDWKAATRDILRSQDEIDRNERRRDDAQKRTLEKQQIDMDSIKERQEAVNLLIEKEIELRRLMDEREQRTEERRFLRLQRLKEETAELRRQHELNPAGEVASQITGSQTAGQLVGGVAKVASGILSVIFLRKMALTLAEGWANRQAGGGGGGGLFSIGGLADLVSLKGAVPSPSRKIGFASGLGPTMMAGGAPGAASTMGQIGFIGGGGMGPTMGAGIGRTAAIGVGAAGAGGLAGGAAGGAVGFGAGLLGGGLGALLLGGGALLGIGALISALGALQERFGPLTSTFQLFQHLTKEAGVDAERLAASLRNATRGLVGEEVLMGGMNKILRSGKPFDQQALMRVTRQATDLARIQGQNPEEQVQQLMEAMSRGETASAAYALGLSDVSVALLQQNEILPEAARLQADLNVLTHEFGEELTDLGGAPMETMSEALTRLSSDLGVYISRIRTAFQESQGYADIVGMIGRLGGTAESIVPEGSAEFFGKAGGKLLHGLVSSIPGLNLIAAADQYGLLGGGEEPAPGEEAPPVQGQPAAPKLSPKEQEELNRARRQRERAQLDREASAFEARLARQGDLLNAHYELGQATFDDYLSEQEGMIAEQEEYRVGLIEKQTQLDRDELTAGLRMREQILQEELTDLETQTQERIELAGDAEDEITKIVAEASAKRLEIEAMRIQAPQRMQEELATLEIQKQAKIDQVHEQAEQRRRDLDLRRERDKQQADRQREETQATVQAKNRREAVADQERLFEQGLRTGEEYLDARKKQIGLEYQAQMDAADRAYNYSQKNEAARAALEDRYKQAGVDKLNEELRLEIQKNEIIMRGILIKKQRQDELYSTERLAPEAAQVPLADEHIAQNEEIIQQLMDMEVLTDEDARHYEERLKLARQIKDENRELLRIMAQMNEFSAAAGTMETVGRLFSRFESGRGVARGLFGASETFAGIGGYQTTAVNLGFNKPGGDNGLAATNVFAGLGETLKSLFEPAEEGSKTFGQKLGEVNDVLGDTLSVVGGFISAVQSRSVAGAGLGGAMAGAGMMSQFGGIFQGTSLGFLAGPVGGLIGGAAGAIAGIFTARAKKKTEEAARKLAEAFNKIVEELSFGGSKLTDALQDLVNLRQETISKLSGRKGGREQLDQLLPQMDAQIRALRHQRDELIKSMSKEIEILSQPMTFEGAIRTIDQLIEKYKEFDGAIGDSTKTYAEFQRLQKEFEEQSGLSLSLTELTEGKEMTSEEMIKAVMEQQGIFGGLRALKDEGVQDLYERLRASAEDYATATEHAGDAQEYLNLAVKRFAEEQQRDLTAAEQDAIENAIRLNELYEQRKEILEDYRNAEYDILSRGNVKRQRTEAQRKMEELDELRKARDEALKNIDRQIELTKLRYDSEKQIFDLSMVRVDMESRLLELQKANIMEDIQRIQALARVVDALSSGTANMTDLSSFIASLVGNPLTEGSGSQVPQAYEDLYATYGRYAFNGFNGEF